MSLTFDLSVVNVTVTTPPQGSFIFRSLQLATIYYITHLKCLFTVVREEGGPKFIKVCHMTLPTPLKGKIIACTLASILATIDLRTKFEVCIGDPFYRYEGIPNLKKISHVTLHTPP